RRAAVAARHRQSRQARHRLHAQPVLPETVTAVRNSSAIAAANAAGFTINVSANNPAEADALADLEIGPVVTILAHDYARRAVRHGRNPGPTNGSRRLPNGATASPGCRSGHRPDGGSRPARRLTPTSPARAAAPVPS